MSSNQTWNVEGRIMTHAQLMEWKKKQKKVEDVVKTEDVVKVNFMQLKKIAKDKGMEVKSTTTKQEIEEFLAWEKQ